MKNIHTVLAAKKIILSPVGQGEGEPETFTAEQVATKVAEANAVAIAAAKKDFEKETAGLSKKNKELLETLTSTTEKLKKTEGVDIEALLALQTTIANDEILSLAAAGKHSEAIDKATEKMRVTHSAELEASKTELTKLLESSQKDKQLVDKLMIDGGSQSAFITAKGIPEAVADIALRARQVWKVEDGELVARDSDGEMIKGEKGPITMAEWVEKLKTDAPHLYPASESAKLKGNKGGKVDLNDIDEQIIAAAKSGDTTLMRKLKLAKAESTK